VTIGTFNKKTAQKNYSMKQLIDRKVNRNTEEEGIREGSQDEAKKLRGRTSGTQTNKGGEKCSH